MDFRAKPPACPLSETDLLKDRIARYVDLVFGVSDRIVVPTNGFFIEVDNTGETPPKFKNVQLNKKSKTDTGDLQHVKSSSDTLIDFQAAVQKILGNVQDARKGMNENKVLENEVLDGNDLDLVVFLIGAARELRRMLAKSALASFHSDSLPDSNQYEHMKLFDREFSPVVLALEYAIAAIGQDFPAGCAAIVTTSESSFPTVRNVMSYAPGWTGEKYCLAYKVDNKDQRSEDLKRLAIAIDEGLTFVQSNLSAKNDLLELVRTLPLNKKEEKKDRGRVSEWVRSFFDGI